MPEAPRSLTGKSYEALNYSSGTCLDKDAYLIFFADGVVSHYVDGTALGGIAYSLFADGSILFSSEEGYYMMLGKINEEVFIPSVADYTVFMTQKFATKAGINFCS